MFKCCVSLLKSRNYLTCFLNLNSPLSCGHLCYQIYKLIFYQKCLSIEKFYSLHYNSTALVHNHFNLSHLTVFSALHLLSDQYMCHYFIEDFQFPRGFSVLSKRRSISAFIQSWIAQIRQKRTPYSIIMSCQINSRSRFTKKI